MYDLPITAYSGQELDIVVENQGRVNYGKELKDFKVNAYCLFVAISLFFTDI